MTGRRKTFVHNLRVNALIGVHLNEKTHAQPVLISITLEQKDTPHDDKLENVVCYDALSERIEALAQTGFNLIESLAEAVADLCLNTHEDILSARVQIKKPKALAKADYAGVEIFRDKS